MSLFKNKYRVEPARLQNWDYGWKAKYFVAIITKNSEHFFDEIMNTNMVLSETGNIACDEWKETTEIRPDMNIKFH